MWAAESKALFIPAESSAEAEFSFPPALPAAFPPVLPATFPPHNVFGTFQSETAFLVFLTEINDTHVAE